MLLMAIKQNELQLTISIILADADSDSYPFGIKQFL